MTVFRVWIHVERHDERNDEYTDCDLMIASTAEFTGRRAGEKAEEFANLLHNVGEQLPGGNENEGGAI